MSLPAILLKFRRYAVGFSGDIREMFHQVQIREDDVQAQRFLWRNLDEAKPPETYLMKAMIFGSACSPCSAQFVKNLNATEFQDQFPDAARAIIESHYMDDLLDSKPSEKEAIKLIHDVIHVHHQAGFEIRNFVSSSKAVLQSLPPELRAVDEKNLCMETDMPTERVLGMWWDPNDDSFIFKLKFNRIPAAITSGEKIPTKREVLRVIMSVFDPIGLIAHVIIQARILFKEIWKSAIDWDDQINDDCYKDWKKWL